jgi:hypothetical protein
VYALRTSYAAPPHPVRIDPSGVVTALPCVDPPELPGELTELTANTADGVEVPSWLVLPRSSVYFPAENHWVLSPQHAKIWYQVVTGSWPSTCWGRASSSPKLWGRRAPVSWRP